MTIFFAVVAICYLFGLSMTLDLAVRCIRKQVEHKVFVSVLWLLTALLWFIALPLSANKASVEAEEKK